MYKFRFQYEYFQIVRYSNLHYSTKILSMCVLVEIKRLSAKYRLS